MIVLLVLTALFVVAIVAVAVSLIRSFEGGAPVTVPELRNRGPPTR